MPEGSASATVRRKGKLRWSCRCGRADGAWATSPSPACRRRSAPAGLVGAPPKFLKNEYNQALVWFAACSGRVRGLADFRLRARRSPVRWSRCRPHRRLRRTDHSWPGHPAASPLPARGLIGDAPWRRGTPTHFSIVTTPQPGLARTRAREMCANRSTQTNELSMEARRSRLGPQRGADLPRRDDLGRGARRTKNSKN